MIDLYYAPTPNGWKITIMLEECELPYTVVPVNLGKGDQFKPEFLAISPNNRMPAIIDHDAPGSGGIRFSISSLLERPPLVCFAENFVDARLVPCERGDCTQARDSSVRADSWGRIKAGL